jgi:hypothetical protein
MPYGFNYQIYYKKKFTFEKYPQMNKTVELVNLWTEFEK